MKILYHHRTRGKWPEGIHINKKISAFERMGHKVVLSNVQNYNILRGSGDNFFGYLKTHLPSLLVELGELGFNLITYFKLKNLIKYEKPSVIYCRYALFDFFPLILSKKYGIPLILEVNAPLAYQRKLDHKFYFYSLAKRLESLIYKNADAIIVVSGLLRKILIKEGVPKSKITVLHNGIDLNYFDGCNYSIKRNYANKVCISYVGSVNEKCAILNLVKLIKYNFKLKNSNVSFFIVGNGDEFYKVKCYINKHRISDLITLVGEVDHKEALNYIYNSDICLLMDSVNLYGSPMKLLEYMFAGKTILAANLPFIKELIVHKENGYLFKKGNSKEFLQYLFLLIKDKKLREKLGKNAKKTVIKNALTWENNASKIINIYKKLI